MRVAETQNSDIDLIIELHDGDHCEHLNLHIEKACCSTTRESGYIECGCGGRNDIVCDNPNCDGVEDYEIELFYERLLGGGSDCE